MTTTLALEHIQVEYKWDYIPATTGGSHESGDTEQIPHSVSLYSVIATDRAGKEVQLIELLPTDQIFEIEQQILQQNY